MTAPIDRLSTLLERFRVRSHLFHTGPLCGVTHFDAQEGRAFLHVLRTGEMTVTHRARDGVPRKVKVTEPTLLFYPRPLAHTFHNAPVDGADFVCATVVFEGGNQHPLARALPPLVVLPLSAVDGIGHTLALLFSETESLRCGSRILADRVLDVLILQLLRWLLDHPEQVDLPQGLLTGLAHPRIAAALTALHEKPGEQWSLVSMAAVAGMSRSAFASAFKAHTGSTPADYLTHWRIAIVQGMLRRGTPVKVAAGQMGYQSAASLSRAFTQATGMSPRTWLQAQSAPA